MTDDKLIRELEGDLDYIRKKAIMLAGERVAMLGRIEDVRRRLAMAKKRNLAGLAPLAALLWPVGLALILHFSRGG